MVHSDSSEIKMEQQLNDKKVHTSVKGLMKLISNENKSNKALFSEVTSGNVNLVLSMYKLPQIPKQGVRKMKIKVKLPHSFREDNCEVLLITQDGRKMKLRGNDEPATKHFTRILKRDKGEKLISQIMPLHQLRTQYKDYEAKRNLATRFDVVLCDETVVRRVPMFLGKAFYGTNKKPIPVNLKTRHPAREVKQALRTAYLQLDLKGNSSMVQVGSLQQPIKQLVANIHAVCNKLDQIPGGWKNIQALYLKTPMSKTVPLFLNLTNRSEVPSVNLPKTKKKSTDFAIDDHPLDDTKLIKVYATGEIYTINKKNEEETELNEDDIDDVPVECDDNSEPADNNDDDDEDIAMESDSEEE